MDAASFDVAGSDVASSIDADPSPARPSRAIADPTEIPLEFLIGRDAGGHWLAVETHGLAGGFFASARDALRFVHSDCHPRAARIEIVEDVLEPFGASCHEIAARCRKRHAG